MFGESTQKGQTQVEWEEARRHLKQADRFWERTDSKWKQSMKWNDFQKKKKSNSEGFESSFKLIGDKDVFTGS